MNQKLTEGEPITLSGFIHNIRVQKTIIFIALRNTLGLFQLVILKENVQAFEKANALTLESIIEISGKVKLSQSKNHQLEIEVELLTVISQPTERLPIQVHEKAANETEIDTRLNYRWIDLRKPENLLIYKIWTLIEQEFRNFLIEKSFIQIHSPKLMGNPSESGAEVFEVKYFNSKAYLAQSPQFYKQMAIAAGFEKVFEIGPVFRAENSNSTRHATEYTSFDIEMAYINSFQDVADLEELIIIHIFEKLIKTYGDEIEKLYGITLTIPKAGFPKIALHELRKSIKEMSREEGDVTHADEKLIGEYVQKEFGHEFVFLTHFHHANRAFYHKKNEKEQIYSESADLLFKGLEITTLAQREHRYEILKSQVEERGMYSESLQEYLNFFKYSCPPHGGFGFGIERFIMKILGLENVREVFFLFRGPGRLTP